MSSVSRIQVLIITLTFVGFPLAAHHSSAIYDKEKILRLQGSVVGLKWANPHVYLEANTVGQSGQTELWLVEGLPPAGMRSGGWTRDSLVPGEEIVFIGNPARKSGVRKILGQSVIKADGTILEIPSTRDSDGPAPVDLPVPLVANDLSGRWATRWNPKVVSEFLQAGSFWPLTDKGIAAMDSYNSSLDPGIKCVPEPSPYVMIWPSGKSLEISDELVMIRDELGVERSIHMNVDSHDGADYVDQGHSIGRWDDDALIVDTTHFANHRRGLAFAGLASGQQKHLVERFELSDDGITMDYTFWLNDPEYLAEPVTGHLEMVYRPDRPFVSEPCDLESASRHLVE